MFSQQKFMYNFFKNCNSDENLVLHSLINWGQESCISWISSWALIVTFSS